MLTPVVIVQDTKGKLIGNYLAFLDTGERRNRAPLWCKFCKIIFQNECVKLKRWFYHIDKESGRFIRIRVK
jgi:hypothetical protein